MLIKLQRLKPHLNPTSYNKKDIEENKKNYKKIVMSKNEW